MLIASGFVGSFPTFDDIRVLGLNTVLSGAQNKSRCMTETSKECLCMVQCKILKKALSRLEFEGSIVPAT